MDSGVLMIFPEKITSSKTSFQMASIYWWWTHISEWRSTSTWLNHDYGDGGVVDILVVDAYSGVDVYMPIFLGEASKIFFF
jgi:hypothetical protein